MANYGEVQNMTTERALHEQNQQLRKQLKDMKTQMQAIMANLEIMDAKEICAYYSHWGRFNHVIYQEDVQRRRRSSELHCHPLRFSKESKVLRSYVSQDIFLNNFVFSFSFV
jgi:hypothetical protein